MPHSFLPAPLTLIQGGSNRISIKKQGYVHYCNTMPSLFKAMFKKLRNQSAIDIRNSDKLRHQERNEGRETAVYPQITLITQIFSGCVVQGK